jgi:CHASE2 domain-containing sensor protein
MGMDPALLDGTPFTSWVWPGVALAVVVGLPMLVAVVAEWRRAPRAPYVSLAAGVALMTWITVQVALIGYQTWLQPTFFLVGLAVTSLASPRATRMR